MGGAFDYYQYHIDDIVARIEREIERATCERPPLVTKQGVSVWKIESPTYKSYCMNYRFKTFDKAVEYFNNSPHYELLKGGSRELVTMVHFKDIFSGEVYEIKSYTYEEYEQDEDGEIPYFPDYTPETIQEFRNGVEILKKASVYAQRIDWLISGDDGEDSFHQRLKEDLNKLETNESSENN